jgi:RNA polymerase sigma-70 factor (ECF subfamily)
MYRILRNTFLTSQTGLKASISFDDEDGAEEPTALDTPETLLLARMESEAIRTALEELPVNHREMILLCDVEEMSYQEIAQTVGVPMGTVMSRLWRARRAMRTALAAKMQGGRP